MTTPAASLLAAILAEPDCDDHRLIYADCLEESGEGARAEFIRVQVELARLQTDGFGPVCDKCARVTSFYQYTARCRGAACKLRMREYYSGRRYTVWEWCDGIPGGWPVTYRRGFVHGITIKAKDFFAHAAAILAKHPVREVTLTTWPVIEAFRDASNSRSLFRLHGYRYGAKFNYSVCSLASSLSSRQAICRSLLHDEWPKIDFTVPDGFPNPDNIIVSTDLLENAIAR